MSTFNWSATGFPNPAQDAGIRNDPSVLRIDMDSGRARQRKLFTTAMRTMTVRWQLTDPQWALFQGVLEHKLNQGADWFNIVLPTGDGLKTCVARFVKGAWTAKYVPVMHWDVSASLEVQGNSPLSSSEVDTLLE